MIDTLQVKNYRSFPDYAVEKLGRINLFVGKNNCGKTSLLEAIQIAASGVDPQVLWEIATRRGESFVDDSDAPPYRKRTEIDISHWFYGFGYERGVDLRIALLDGISRKHCEISIAEAAEAQRRLFPADQHVTSVSSSGPFSNDMDADSELYAAPPFALKVVSSESKFPHLHSLTGRGGLTIERLSKSRSSKDHDVVFVPTAGLATSSLVAMVDDLALTDDEGLALRAMQTLDSRIERFAAKGRDNRPRIMIRLQGTNKPLPIGSLGDGVNRLLTIAVALAKSSGGILLIDEIDTGLHHTAMDRMWKFVSEAAAQLNVQVFATTHSRDCYESLSILCEIPNSSLESVSIQRIDAARSTAVSYTKDEIVAAARRGLEVR